MANFFYVQSKLNNLVLDITGSNGAAGTPIIAWSKNPGGTANQLWYLDDYGFIVSKMNGFALDIQGSIGNPGTPLIAFPRKSPVPGSENQRWILSPGGYIRSELNQNLVLDIRGGQPTPGAQIIVWTVNAGSTPNQLWSFVW